MIRLVAVLAAAVLGMLLLLAPAASAVTAEATSDAIYMSDGRHHSASPAGAWAERGPPVEYDRHTTCPRGVDRWSCVALSRPDDATSPAPYNYDDLGRSAQVARGSWVTQGHDDDGRSSYVRAKPWSGAAKTAPELASGMERTGTALSKSDAFHRSVSWVVDAPAAQRFAAQGGDGVSRELYQLPGEVNGKSGVFEWIIDRSGTSPVINHQRFIPGGSVTGYPNQVVP